MAKTKLYFKNGKTYFKSGGKFHELPKAQVGIGGLATPPAQDPSKLESFMTNYGSKIEAALPAVLSAIPQKDKTITDPFVASRMPTENNQVASGLSSGLDVASQFLGPMGQAVNLGRKVVGAIGNTIGGAIGGEAGDVVSSVLDPTKLVGNLIEDPTDPFGIKERRSREKYQEELSKRSAEIKAMNAGTNKGNVYTHGVYAKKGKNILTEPSKNIKKPNVEIEHDEIYLGNPGNVTKYDDATTSLTSKYATKFHGDWHGEDTDKDGMEGIPLNAPDGYIASNYLGLDGRPVKGQKDSKKTGKTVADEMTPLIKFLHDAEQNPKDLYKNNPAAIKQVLKQLEKMKNTAEKNKFREELIKMLRDKQGFDLESILAFIQENAPMEDMNPEEQQALQQIIGGGQEQQMPQQGEQELSPEMIQQMMAAQGQQTPQAKYGKSMNNYYKRYQQGGMTPEQMMQMQQQAQPQEQPNKSSERMAMLLDKARMATGQGPMNPSVDQMGDQVKDMFDALPDDVKQQIMDLPADQQEIAIINTYNQLVAQQQAMAAQGQEQMMEGEAEMEEAGMSPEDVAATAEEQVLEMMFGGNLAKAQKGKNQYMDAYANAAKALGLSDEEIMQQIKEQEFAFKPKGKLKSDSVIADQIAADELIKSIPGLFNNEPQPKSRGIENIINDAERKYGKINREELRDRIDKMLEQEYNNIIESGQMELLNDNRRRDAIIEKEIEKAMMLDKEMSKQKGYQMGGKPTMTKTISTTDPYSEYVNKLREPGLQKLRQESGNPHLTYTDLGLPVSQFKNPQTGEMNIEYLYGNKKYKTTVPKLPTRDEFTKQQSSAMKPMSYKADGGYPDSTTNRSGFTNEYYGDQYRGKSYDYRDGQSPKDANAHMPRGMMSDRFNPLMGNNVDPYSAFGEQGDSRGNNGVTTFDNRRKFETELAKSKQGGMIGKTIKYKKGGQVKTGKVIGISKTGKYIVK